LDGVAAAVVRRSEQGFVLLAVLVIVALAAVAGAVTYSLARNGLATSLSDGDALSAAASARAGLAAAAQMVRRSACAPDRQTSCSAKLGTRQCYGVTIEPEVASAGHGEARFDVAVEGRAGQARQLRRARLALRPAPYAGACVCSGTCTVESPTQLSGSGLCAGGDVAGREYVALSVEPDRAFGDLWSVTGVHAGGSIVAAGGEIHQTGRCSLTDTDQHVGVAPPSTLTRGPTVADIAFLTGRSVSPGGALEGGVLHLDRLPLQAPSDGSLIIVVPSSDGEVLCLRGERPDYACDVTVVVEGPASVQGPAGEEVRMHGGLLVCGSLEIVSPFCLEGCLWAEELAIRAPLSVALPSTWPERLPAGFSQCAVLALE
jgi:hypothetical protein